METSGGHSGEELRLRSGLEKCRVTVNTPKLPQQQTGNTMTPGKMQRLMALVYRNIRINSGNGIRRVTCP